MPHHYHPQASGVARAELIIRKSQELDQMSVPVVNVSPPQSTKVTKKLSVLSLKQKMPHSPSIKRRKTTSGDKSDKSDKGWWNFASDGDLWTGEKLNKEHYFLIINQFDSILIFQFLILEGQLVW